MHVLLRKEGCMVRLKYILLIAISILISSHSFAQQNENYLFLVDRFQITGNLPNGLSEEFTNGIGQWTPIGTVAEPGDYASLQNSGAIDDSLQTVYPIRILASSITAPPEFDVVDGQGNFVAESVWYPDVPVDNQYFSIGLVYENIESVGVVTKILQFGITDIDHTDAALFDFNPLSPSLALFKSVQYIDENGDTVLYDMQVAGANGIVSGNVHLKLSFTDSINRLQFSYSLNGGVNWLHPLSENVVLAGDAQWRLNAGVFLLGYPVVNLKMPRPPVVGNVIVESVFLTCSQGTDETEGGLTSSHRPDLSDRRYAVDFDSPNYGQNEYTTPFGDYVYDDLPVTASVAGKAHVIFDGQSDHGYGNHVNVAINRDFYVNDGTTTIDPARKLFVTHAHLAHVAANLPAMVKQGEFLGVEGNSGLGCLPYDCDHIHFGLQFGDPTESTWLSTSLPFESLQADVGNNGVAEIISWSDFDDSVPCVEANPNGGYEFYESTNRGPQCNNGIDDEGDGGIDFAGYDANGDGVITPQPNNEEKQADGQCVDINDGCEKDRCGCGIGAELVFVLTPLYFLYSRRRKFLY